VPDLRCLQWPFRFALGSRTIRVLGSLTIRSGKARFQADSSWRRRVISASHSNIRLDQWAKGRADGSRLRTRMILGSLLALDAGIRRLQDRQVGQNAAGDHWGHLLWTEHRALAEQKPTRPFPFLPALHDPLLQPRTRYAIDSSIDRHLEHGFKRGNRQGLSYCGLLRLRQKQVCGIIGLSASTSRLCRLPLPSMTVTVAHLATTTFSALGEQKTKTLLIGMNRWSVGTRFSTGRDGSGRNSLRCY
jgi:hypothetical protein